VKAAVVVGINELKNEPTEYSLRSDTKKRECIVH